MEQLVDSVLPRFGLHSHDFIVLTRQAIFQFVTFKKSFSWFFLSLYTVGCSWEHRNITAQIRYRLPYRTGENMKAVIYFKGQKSQTHILLEYLKLSIYLAMI